VDKGRGKIVNIASLLSFQGGIRIPSYTASKSGLAGLTKLLACELAGKGVNVNAIAGQHRSMHVVGCRRCQEYGRTAEFGR
ncbi:SDR family NAD(P)-dependent oxidoreductase, partial [Rhizobium ruizarguesonis]